MIPVSFPSICSIVLISAACFCHYASSATVEQWRSRSIYQVLTDRFSHTDGSGNPPCNVEHGLYCGGTWKGIKNNLDYIQGMGFDAVWISPITEQLPQLTGVGESYAGYWQQNLWGINERFGSEDDLIELIEDIHDRQMYVMLDVVVNHMGYAGPGPDMNQAVIRPFNHERYYHDYCEIDQPNNLTQNQICWMGDISVSLADLRTETKQVRNILGEWISETVSNYSIDGLRIDAAFHVEPDFFTGFMSSAGVFGTGEVMRGEAALACEWEETIGSVLNYPVYYPLIRAFQTPSGSFQDLTTAIRAAQSQCSDPSALGSFSENHDVPRFAQYTQDLAQAMNVLAFTFMADGIPIVYQGQEHHLAGAASPHYNRSPLWGTQFDTDTPLYEHITRLNALRSHLASHDDSDDFFTDLNSIIHQSDHVLAMRKGRALTVLTNSGADTYAYTVELGFPAHRFQPGTRLTEIVSCVSRTVDGTGGLEVPMDSGEPRVLFPTEELRGSGLCGLGGSRVVGDGGSATSTGVRGEVTETASGGSGDGGDSNGENGDGESDESTGSDEGFIDQTGAAASETPRFAAFVLAAAGCLVLPGSGGLF